MRRRTRGRRTLGIVALAVLAAVGVARESRAVLDTPGFRAVGVALSRYPVSALAVAPDGRLFAAVQALGRSFDPDPGTAEIRVFSAYASNDGSVLDEGTVWATLEGVRATNVEEGLIGLALAPDFATSGLVYVHVTTIEDDLPDDDDRDQEILVYRENGSGRGDYLGTVMRAVEPPQGNSFRNGGPLAFGADGCLYLGVGDNGGNDRWSAQMLRGTDPFQSFERSELCDAVCRGSTEYPTRPLDDHDGKRNNAGKVLRLAVEGRATVQGGPLAPFSLQPYVFAAGFRNPMALATHPLTGQLYVGERGDSQEAEVGVADVGSNHGWPCLEGQVVSTTESCLSGFDQDDVYFKHPSWRRPLATHPGNGEMVSGIAAYTGLAFPEEFYGDVFYLLRNGARIYRMDLQPPCFLPDPAGVTPIAFHDSDEDGDFLVRYDVDEDGDFENVNLQNLVAIVQAENPLGQQVLYVAGKQGNGSNLEDDTVVFRIEFATAFTPYAGPTGRVPDSCFTDGTYSGAETDPGSVPYGYENPFHRLGCLPPGGPCPGQPDGTPCDDGDVCNGSEECFRGICQAGTPAADGTACDSDSPCRPGGICESLACTPGAAAPDGTPCADGDPCNGLELCAAGECQPGAGPAPLSLRTLKLRRDTAGPGTGRMTLKGSFDAAVPVAPDTTESLSLELADGGGPFFAASVDHPTGTPYWRRKGGTLRYRDGAGTAGGLTSIQLRPRKGGRVRFSIKGRGLTFGELDEALSSRLIVGDQCFTVDAPSCTLDPRRLRCR